MHALKSPEITQELLRKSSIGKVWKCQQATSSCHLAYPCDLSQAIRRSPFIHSSISVLLLKPSISRGSAPG
jgi:hypothetical protein